IFSIMMVFMLFKNPLQALMQTNAAFTKYETPRTKSKMWVVKAVYVLMNLVALGLGIWKVNGMGLLPYVDIPEYGWRRHNLADMFPVGLRDPIGLPGRPNENLSSALYSPFDDL
ncbi:MAG: hypothetical protein Q9204_004893, partial [Flavoplaca sp. TL-2023a]